MTICDVCKAPSERVVNLIATLGSGTTLFDDKIDLCDSCVGQFWVGNILIGAKMVKDYNEKPNVPAPPDTPS